MSSLERVGGTAQHPPDGTFVIGPYGIIEDADDAACRLVGYPREELVGMHGAELIPPAAQPATAASLDRMRRGELTQRDGQMQRQDGRVFDIAVRARPLPEGRVELKIHTRPSARA